MSTRDETPTTMTPEQMAVRAATGRPPGWDHVHDWDDCNCPKGGQHQLGCDHHGWEAAR